MDPPELVLYLTTTCNYRELALIFKGFFCPVFAPLILY